MQPEAEIACIGPILFFTVTDRWDMNFYIIGSRGEGVSNAAMKNLCHLKLQLQLIVTRAITASKISVLSFLPVSYDVGVLIWMGMNDRTKISAREGTVKSTTNESKLGQIFSNFVGLDGRPHWPNDRMKKKTETFAFIETEKFQLEDGERNEKRSRGLNLHGRKTQQHDGGCFKLTSGPQFSRLRTVGVLLFST